MLVLALVLALWLMDDVGDGVVDVRVDTLVLEGEVVVFDELEVAYRA